ncbi:MAG: hypothetical protein P1U61_05265 [Legionellaceae bacterium]|nr:hypothetical protein [Legionellaceae bacterium]
MPENKTSSFRMKRELVHINQAFFSSPRYTHPLNYESKPLALLKPKIQAQGSGKEGNTSAKINVSY